MAFFALGVIILLSFGKFDQTAAQCADGECGAPPTSSNVRYTPATPCYTDTATVTYQCNGTLTGSPNNTCGGGSWTQTSATCTALEGEERMTLTCGSQRFKVEIPVDLVNANNIDLIHLKDRTCTAAEVPGESNYLYIESTYGQCGTTVQVDSARKEVTYVNKIQAELSRDGKTSKQRPLDIDINCKFDQSNVVSTSVIVANEITSALAIFGHYFTLSIYLDDVFSVEKTPPVYIMEDYPAIVKLQMEAEKNETLAASDCYVTPSSDPSDPDFRDIIHDGCAVISEVTILDISPSQSSKPAMAFSMSRMHFGGDSDEVFVHCYAASCKDDSCGATCPSTRRRRSVNAYHLLTQGPIIWQEYEPSLDGAMAQAVALMVFSGVVATISLIIIIFVAYRCLCRKKPEPKLDLYY